MRVKTAWTLTALAIAVFGLGAGIAFAQSEQFIPRLVYRTGPYAPNGIPFADGYADYLDMINARDGGVGGVKITYEECETGYNNDKGVECYERLKNNGPTGASLVDPLSTGITYALIERATADKIPVVSMGYGRADASDGAVFPYVFTLPATYWAQADAMIKYLGYPMDHFIGVWWSGSEPDVVPAGEAAVGYKSGTFHGAGQDYGVVKDILKYVYDKNGGHATRDKVGEVLFNRGVINAIYDLESI